MNWLIVESLVSKTIQIHFGATSDWGSIAYDANSLYLGIELACSDLDQSFSSCQWLWVVLEVDSCHLQSEDVTLLGRDDNVWMGLHYFYCVFKVHWTVTLDLKLLVVTSSKDASFAHINCTWEQLSLFGVYYRESVDWNQQFVAFTVDPHWIIVVLVLVGCGCELDVNVFSDTGGEHTFLVVSDFEIGRLGRQNMQTLRGRRVV